MRGRMEEGLRGTAGLEDRGMRVLTKAGAGRGRLFPLWPRIVLGVFLLACLAALGPGPKARAASPPSPALELLDDQGFYHLGPYLDVLLDPTGGLTLEQVRRSPDFRPNGRTMLQLGTVRGAAWLRFRLVDRTPPNADRGPGSWSFPRSTWTRLISFWNRRGAATGSSGPGRSGPLAPS